MIAALLRFLHRRCRHPGDNVVADILEGDRDGRPVSWCRTCGAIMRSRNLWELAVDPRPRGIDAHPALALVVFLLAAPALAAPKLQALQPQPVTGGIAFTWPGAFHSPAPGSEIAVANLPTEGAYARAILEVDITFGGWAEDGTQNLFWLHRGLCCWPKWSGGIVGYADAKRSGWRVDTDVGLTQHTRATGKWRPEVGKPYRVRYDYDTTTARATLQIWDGRTIATEASMAIPRGELQSAGGFMAYFGHESAAGHGPERPSYGWTYGNLRVSLTSGGEPTPVPPPPSPPTHPPAIPERLCVGLDVTGGVVRSAATGERYCPEVP